MDYRVTFNDPVDGKTVTHETPDSVATLLEQLAFYVRSNQVEKLNMTVLVDDSTPWELTILGNKELSETPVTSVFAEV